MTRPDGDDRQPGLFGSGGDGPLPAEPAESAEAARAPATIAPPDAAERAYATDPRHNVVLEASAGTGKTTVLVHRYLNLLGAGVDPSHILAMTFTRKAAAEMRQRIVAELRQGAARSEAGRARWLRVRDRVGEIAISTIDAFCLSLLREFPLEAGLDPSFRLADETEVARLVERALDETLRVARALACQRPDLAYVLTQLTPAQVRDGLRHLIERRAVALPALGACLARADAPATAGDAVRAALEAGLAAIVRAAGSVQAWVDDGPHAWPPFAAIAHDVAQAGRQDANGEAASRRAFDRLRHWFLTQKGEARRSMPCAQRYFAGRDAFERHRQALSQAGPEILATARRLDAQVNAVLARGILQLARIAESAYCRAMDAEDLLDFTGTLDRAVTLLRQMDEFSRSRFRLESRYHHVLVDEFQDTNRLQWALVSLLVEAWGAGEGVAGGPLPPTVFVVGDRKQSIYRFRDAEVALLDEAARHIAALRPGDRPRRAISASFRSAPALLAFVNDLFAEVRKAPDRRDAFRYDDTDRFPMIAAPVESDGPALGIASAVGAGELAGVVASEIVRAIASRETVRDRATGVRRPVGPGDIAILFRARDSHRDYERALDARGVPTYVYKGLGFFEAEETQDLSALVRFLARPASPLREAALLRSRIFRVSDAALVELAPDLGRVARARAEPAAVARLGEDDRRVVAMTRAAMGTWLPMVDHLPPADLVDRILRETAYAFELRGPRRDQARENVKKFRALVRRLQNRGYATMARIAAHLDRLSLGDESNAAIDAMNAVHLMTVHASKGLEFPVVFVVDLARGVGARGGAVRVVAEDHRGEPAVSIGTMRFEADEEEERRDREETKRLLYVALTRARDRLYLAGALRAGGEFRPSKGSLGEVLPASLGAVLEEAARAAGPRVTWTAASGEAHAFRRCALDPRALPTGDPAEDAVRLDLLGPLAADPELPVRAVRTLVDPGPAPPRRRHVAADPLDVTAGRLVHRLFQRVGVSEAAAIDDATLAERAMALLRPEEHEALVAPGEAVASACRTWRQLVRRGAAVGLFDGEVLHEVPFTLFEPAGGGATGPGVAIRGVIDCLVRAPDGRVRVIEVKTGRRAGWHERQLALYVRAAEALFPGAAISGVILAPDAGSDAGAGMHSPS